jgi:hypothetical protein
VKFVQGKILLCNEIAGIWMCLIYSELIWNKKIKTNIQPIIRSGSIIGRLIDINRMIIPYQFTLYKTIVIACAWVLSLFFKEKKSNRSTVIAYLYYSLRPCRLLVFQQCSFASLSVQCKLMFDYLLKICRHLLELCWTLDPFLLVLTMLWWQNLHCITRSWANSYHPNQL